MELRRITDQGGESLSEYFAKVGEHGDEHESRRIFSEQMIALISFLEQEVDGPPQWVTTSHYSFYMGGVDHWDPWKARVFVRLLEEGFQIRYRSAPELNWEASFTILSAGSVHEAAALVEMALQQALPHPPGRFDDALY